MAAGAPDGRAWSWPAALEGVVPPLITPLCDDGGLDEAALVALIEHVLAAGCSGLFVLGGCGEGAWLTSTQRAAVVRAAVRAAAGRVPVLAGVLLPGTAPACEAARQAAAEGANALVVSSPYYYRVDAAVQRRHVEAILAATELPVLLYNIPQATGHVLAPETVAALAVEPRVLGIKDSAGDMAAFQRQLAIRQQWPEFRVLQGHEHLMAASLLLGADGLVPGLANVAPELFVALRHAASFSDVAACVRLQGEIADLWTLHHQGHWLAALKAACAVIGLGTGLPAVPLAPASAVQRQAIAAILQRYVPGVALAGAPGAGTALRAPARNW